MKAVRVAFRVALKGPAGTVAIIAALLVIPLAGGMGYTMRTAQEATDPYYVSYFHGVTWVFGVLLALSVIAAVATFVVRVYQNRHVIASQTL